MSTPLTDGPTFARLLRPLLGRWIGHGHGRYPTLDDFEYREELELAMRDGDDTLRYDQRTWRLVDGGERPSHWEVGLLRLEAEGALVLYSAQNGRTEILRGGARLQEDGAVRVDLEAVAFGDDPRLRATSRTVLLGPDTVSYEMSMATDRVPGSQLHLRDRLQRPT